MTVADRRAGSEATLDASIASLRGIGPAKARALAGLGLSVARDLLFLLPRRARTASEELSIIAACERRGEEVTLRGVVERLAVQRFGRRSTLRIVVRDASGSIAVLFFNQPWMRKSFELGKEVVLRGKVGVSRGPALLSPRIGTGERPLSAAGTIELHYPAVEGVSSETVGRLARELAARFADGIEEPLPAELLAARDLPPLAEAVRDAHAPTSIEAFERARRRLVLEPLLRLQARLTARRRSRAESGSLRVGIDASMRAELLARFPFEFTQGQLAIVDELAADLARGAPMRRLLQGDVGSGKTVLGAFACLAVARAGAQSAFLAPTELLAEQHFAGLRELLRAAGLHAVFLTGSLPAAERRAALAQLESGMADVVFGTHALFSEDVRYRNLALCVIDEQQRFGVVQRTRLIEKGERVHVLLMTATPIPRTLALTLYGDLETSVLKERPKGRGSVRTKWVRGAERRKALDYLARRLAAGEQAYWVAPRIGAPLEEGPPDDGGGKGVEKGEEASAERAFEKLSATELAAHGIELVHGRLDPEVRAERLARFRSGAAKLLVATTVIEVGVDVPAATVMVIENAERLGLAQLHQLRGRIGRGTKDGWCVLFGKESAAARFAVLERTHDGFEIAEEDLRARGMGDLAGVRQAGINLEGIEELDTELLFLARDLLARDEGLLERYLASSAPTPAP